MGREVEDPNTLVQEGQQRQRQRRHIGKRETHNGETGKEQNGTTEETQSGIPEEPERGKTEEMQNTITASSENGITAKPQTDQATGTQPDETTPPGNVIADEPQSGKVTQLGNRGTAKRDSGTTVQPENRVAGETQNGITEETQSEKELLDQKVTLYLSWRQLDKLDDMVSGYRRRERKRTDQNKLMRMMIDKFNLDDLLGDETK